MDGGGALHRGGARAAGIARHRDLGVIDMRQIAPTVAGILGVGLPAAGAAPLPYRFCTYSSRITWNSSTMRSPLSVVNSLPSM